MANEISRNIRTGILVIVAAAFLIVALYIIGNKRNLFGSTFRISARFHNVNGLMAGNNVRLSGIDVGTVEKVEIVSDSSVLVVMNIEDKVQPYIRKNAIASVGTDGLMGNKLVNINATSGNAPIVQEGDALNTLRPFETDEMLRTLNTTNLNLKVITTDLKEITRRINSSNSLWNIMMDTTVAENVKGIVSNVNDFTRQSNQVAVQVSGILHEMKGGEGVLGLLISDSSFASELKGTVDGFKGAASKVSLAAANFENLSDSIIKGRGVVGTMVNDTAMANNLQKTMEQIKLGATGLSENMEALKHSFLLRKYFRNKEKQKEKSK